MTERRYTDDEVAEIFERAAEKEAASPARHAEGRTLAELTAIASEAGLSPELVVQAAHALEGAGEPERHTFLGFPLTVGRTVHLGRHLTEDEWERLVGDLRVTFNARGRVRTDGRYREWRNGNLRAVLEPAPSGDRLRLHTTKGNARGLMNGGLGLMGIGLALLLTLVLLGEPATELASALLLLLLGGGMLGAGALQLPGWASRRLAQMEEVATRLILPPAVSDQQDTTLGPGDPA